MIFVVADGGVVDVEIAIVDSDSLSTVLVHGGVIHLQFGSLQVHPILAAVLDGNAIRPNACAQIGVDAVSVVGEVQPAIVIPAEGCGDVAPVEMQRIL